MVDLDSGSRFVIIFLKGDLSNMVCDMCVYVNSNLSNIIAINECQSHVLFLRLINWLWKGHFCLQNELLQPFLFAWWSVNYWNCVNVWNALLQLCQIQQKKKNKCKFNLQNRTRFFSSWESLLICVRLWKGKLILKWIGSPSPPFAIHVETFNTNCIVQVVQTANYLDRLKDLVFILDFLIWIML